MLHFNLIRTYWSFFCDEEHKDEHRIECANDNVVCCIGSYISIAFPSFAQSFLHFPSLPSLFPSQPYFSSPVILLLPSVFNSTAHLLSFLSSHPICLILFRSVLISSLSLSPLFFSPSFLSSSTFYYCTLPKFLPSPTPSFLSLPLIFFKPIRFN